MSDENIIPVERLRQKRLKRAQETPDNILRKVSPLDEYLESLMYEQMKLIEEDDDNTQ